MFLQKIKKLFERKETSKPVYYEIRKDDLLNLDEASNVSRLKDLAKTYFWKELDFQPKTAMISFMKGGIRLNVYYTTLTVGTCLEHPTKGKTQLFRKNLNWKQIEKIFTNPRYHTGHGYYKNKSLNVDKVLKV